jgi:glycosyltransferase involved in cell wall biosynthesis
VSALDTNVPNQRVAYLLKTFPRLSETFILNEILGLEQMGLEIQIFSLKMPDAGPVHPSVAAVKAKIDYVPSLGPQFRLSNLIRLLACQFLLLFLDTRRYFGAAKFYFLKPGKSRLKDFLQASYLAWVLRRQRFQHLHVHFANVPATVAEIVHRLIGIPYSLTAHAKDIYLTPRAELARKIQTAACVLTCTAHNRQYLSQLASGRTPVHLAYHGIDVRRFSGEPCRADAHRIEKPLILSVGRFCEKKGFEYLIQSCRLLADRGYSFQCKIVGYGELQNKLEQMILDLELGSFVSLSGKMTQDELATLYPQAGMFVLPCLITDDGDRDGIPNVLIEAMASGTPVISTNVSGIAELIQHNQNGLLVEQRNATALADAMEHLIGRPDTRNRLIQNARSTVSSRFTLEASAQRVYDILRPVLEGRSSRHLILTSEVDQPVLN